MARIEGYAFPDDLWYHPREHLWLRPEREGGRWIVTVGGDALGPDALGEVVYVQLTEAGRAVGQGGAGGSPGPPPPPEPRALRSGLEFADAGARLGGGAGGAAPRRGARQGVDHRRAPGDEGAGMRRSGEIHFYAPGLKRYRTSEYDGQDPGRFVSSSVTGAACALQCDHCRSRVLEGMLPANGKGLFELARDLAGSGARGILVSGGCDRRGRVPLLPHVADLKRIRSELGMTIRVHPGLPDEETAAALGKVGVDGAMLDVIGAEETIREAYHLEVGAAGYAAT